jgi:hypothetical protein
MVDSTGFISGLISTAVIAYAFNYGVSSFGF